jgi:hypothetical protein
MNYRNKIIVNKKKSLPITSLLVGLVLILLIIQVVVSNRIAISGNKITQMEQEINNLNQENSFMNEKIASASSLAVIREKSVNLGFTKNITPFYVSTNLPVAFDLH